MLPTFSKLLTTSSTNVNYILVIVQKFLEQTQSEWQELKNNAIRDNSVEALHNSRESFLNSIQDRIELSKNIISFCKNLSDPTSSNLLAQSQDKLEELQTLHDKLFGEWKTLDDLYQMLCNEISIPHEKLEKHIREHPIPQSWFDEDFSGLFGEDEEASS